MKTRIGDGLDRATVTKLVHGLENRVHRSCWPPKINLLLAASIFHARRMFTVSEEELAAIRTAFDQGGEFAAAVELRRRFPGITDNGQARQCARVIAGWTPLTLPPRPIVELGRLPKGTAAAKVEIPRARR